MRGGASPIVSKLSILFWKSPMFRQISETEQNVNGNK